MKTYDVIIIGGGHNGLTAAAVLARAGKQVLVLERRQVLGGAAATEALWPGYRVNTGAEDAGIFADAILSDLHLKMSGLDFVEPDVSLFAPQQDGGAGLTIYRDLDKTAAGLGDVDAGRYPGFVAEVNRMAGLLAEMMSKVPPDMMALGLNDAKNWGPVALGLRRSGKKEMMEFMRVLPMPLKGYLDEWFDGAALKGALASYGIAGLQQGARSAGTTLMFLYQQAGGFLRTRFVRGGMGQLSAALATAATGAGAEIRSGAAVEKLLLRYDDEGYHAVGVELADGEAEKLDRRR